MARHYSRNTLRENCPNSDPDVDPWASDLHLRRRFHSHEKFDDWCSFCLFLLDSQLNTGSSICHPCIDVSSNDFLLNQITMLLFIAHVLIHGLWKFKIDPDTSAIPYLTALGDLFGSTLLWGAFIFLRFVGHQYEGRGPPGSIVEDFLPSGFDLLLNPFGVK